MSSAPRQPTAVLTVGHSTRRWEEFVTMLREHRIERLVDIRAFPGSRRYPHFGRDPMAAALGVEGIGYLHLPALGGRRRARPDAPATGWRNAGFQGYADYMTTRDFEEGLETLLDHAASARTAVMCSEAVPWRCHRSLLADALTARGVRVLHIVGGEERPHQLTGFASVMNGRVSYATGSGDQLQADL